MARIFWVTCPSCAERFYCHYQALRHTPWLLHCPFCEHEFRQEDSPRLDE
jgi:hypothetical protein